MKKSPNALLNAVNKPVESPPAPVPNGGKFKTPVPDNDYPETLGGKPPHPGYLEKGPLFTREMWDKWTPEMLNLPSRPVRTTRNPNPKYVDAISTAMSSLEEPRTQVTGPPPCSGFLQRGSWSATSADLDVINSSIGAMVSAA